MIWRLVVSKPGVSLAELETTWSVNDILSANEVLDALEEASASANTRE